MATKEQLLAELEKSFEPLANTKAYAKILLYGPSGTGKTVLALQIAQQITPKNKTIAYIDAVEGWTSLLNHPTLQKRVDRSVFKGLSHIEMLCMAIEAKISKFADIGTIILDEYSTMARQDVDVVLTARSMSEPGKDPDVATFTDTGVSTRRMDRGTAKLLKITDYGVHIIILAHERKDKDKSNIEVTSPAFMPAFKAIVKSDMHVVARLTADVRTDTEGNPVYSRRLQVHPSTQVEAKSRVGGLSVFTSPDRFIAVLDAWLQGSGSTEETDRKPVNDVINVEAEDDEFSGGIRVE